MKSKFEIEWDVDETLDEFLEFYEIHLKSKGYLLMGDGIPIAYKEVDLSIMFNEGDRVYVDGWGFTTITFKYFNIDENCIYYTLKEE